MNGSNSAKNSVSGSELLFTAASLIPISQYLLGFLLFFLIILYKFLEIHFIEDFFNGFRGNPVSLTYNSFSEIYGGVVSKCPTLHGRYLATPWLSSPHLQTAFLNFFGRPPVFSYRRQLFHAPDGGTIALDWLMHSDVSRGASCVSNSISKDDATPIVVVVPGLTSDSASAYIKHLSFKIAQRGWNVVVSNHRGLGGISITVLGQGCEVSIAGSLQMSNILSDTWKRYEDYMSDCFYNAGWTEDIRKVVDYLHQECPKAPLFAVGTSIGANVLVKYLGEDGDNTHFAGAVAICSPWDLLICDRFINRRLVQRFYDRVLTIGLQGYAQLHQSAYSRLADWEGIRKSRTVRDFDNYATCLVGKFETVDTYYRHCSSASFVGNVSVPLLCISALDDPVCTREAIPWDECRANKNIVLATTPHGGHLAFFEGITADHLWWVRAVDEFLSALHSGPFMHRWKKTQDSSLHCTLESSIDQGPYVSISEDGMVSAMASEPTSNDVVGNLAEEQNIHVIAQDIKQSEHCTESQTESVLDTVRTSKHDKESDVVKCLHDVTAPVKRCIDQLSRQNGRSMWLLTYIAIVTTWPLLGSALLIVFKKKVKNVLPAAWMRK